MNARPQIPGPRPPTPDTHLVTRHSTPVTRDLTPDTQFDRALPIRTSDINGIDLQTMALRIGDDRSRLIETHRLIVQDRGSKRGKIMALQISACVCDKRKAGG